MKDYKVRVVTRNCVYETSTDADSLNMAMEKAIESCAIAFNVAFHEDAILDIYAEEILD